MALLQPQLRLWLCLHGRSRPNSTCPNWWHHCQCIWVHFRRKRIKIKCLQWIDLVWVWSYLQLAVWCWCWCWWRCKCGTLHLHLHTFDFHLLLLVLAAHQLDNAKEGYELINFNCIMEDYVAHNGSIGQDSSELLEKFTCMRNFYSNLTGRRKSSLAEEYPGRTSTNSYVVITGTRCR